MHKASRKINLVEPIRQLLGEGLVGSLTGKVLRADARGNLRLLLSEGRSFQEIRLVTTVGTAEEGDRIMGELNEILKTAL